VPLYPDVENIIRQNLERIEAGEKPPFVAVGRLTDKQHASLNAYLQSLSRPLLENPEIVYMGRHHYESRRKDGYTTDDMIVQIRSALDTNSVVPTDSISKMSSLRNPNPRADGYGNKVNDQAVFELTHKKPRAELYSVIPKGDKIKPRTKSPPQAEG
jgi:hypothetical protein